MHDPIGLLAMRGSSGVKYEGLSHADSFGITKEMNSFVSPCCFPKSSSCSPVCSRSSWILFILVAKEIPLVLGTRSNSTLIYMQIHHKMYNLSELSHKKSFIYIVHVGLYAHHQHGQSPDPI